MNQRWKEWAILVHLGVLQQFDTDQERDYPGGDRKPSALACDSVPSALLVKPVADEKRLIHSCPVLPLGRKHKVL
jgi:hypothetical protein